MHLPKLTLEQRNTCEQFLTVGECLNTLKTFEKNKTPGNDGFTVEFYLAFWPMVGKHLVECFNYAHEHMASYLIPRGEVLPYMSYIGMCRCEGYGFQAV